MWSPNIIKRNALSVISCLHVLRGDLRTSSNLEVYIIYIYVWSYITFAPGTIKSLLQEGVDILRRHGTASTYSPARGAPERTESEPGVYSTIRYDGSGWDRWLVGPWVRGFLLRKGCHLTGGTYTLTGWRKLQKVLVAGQLVASNEPVLLHLA